MKASLPLLACLLLLPVPARTGSDAAWNTPVVDLRVGLSQARDKDPSLAVGAGQAGYLALERGGVIGVLLPVSTGGFNSRQTTALSEYVSLRGSLESSQRFGFDDCRNQAGRISVWFELEAPNELAKSPSTVRRWIERGVRVFRIAGGHDNELATVSTDTAPGPVSGLTRIGRDVVTEVLAAGALVDVSGASDLTIDDVLELAERFRAPVIATHSNARALADRAGNFSDSTIRAIARSGGLIAATAARDLLAAGRSAKLDHLVRQIVYMVQIAGPEHVGLGTGFESGVGPVRDFHGANDLPRLAVSLRAAGLSAADVERVLYRNAQRLLCAARGTK